MSDNFLNIRVGSALRTAWVLLGLALVVACNQEPEVTTVLKVGDAKIGKQEVRLQMAYMGLGSDPGALTPELRKAALDSIAQRYLILQEAEKQKVSLEPEELEREEHLLRGQMEANDFERALAEQGLDYHQWRQILEEELLSRKMLDLAVTTKVRVSEDEIKAYYESHKEEFRHKERILAEHVVLPTKELANQVRSSLKSGKTLDEICQELGITPLNGGEAVWLEKGHMPEELERKLFRVRPGRVAGPYKSMYGYHVIKVDKKSEAGTSSLAQASESIERIIMDERKQELATRWINELNRKTEVWFDPEFIKNARKTGS